MSTTNDNLIKKFQTNFQDNVENLEKIVKRDNWIFKYDQRSDILYFSPKDKSVSADSVLVPVDDTCMSARVSRDGNIENIIVGEFFNLFLADNKDFIPLANQLKRARSKRAESKDYKALTKSLLFDSLKVLQLTPACP